MSISQKPLVSILITNYNYEKFVSEAIESALQQTYHPIEIIVVDDSSTDNSLSVIEQYKDRIQTVSQINGGLISALNTGFSHCKGEIICLLDSDDVFSPQKIQTVVEIFESFPKCEWCFHSLEYFSQPLESLFANACTEPASGNTDNIQRIDFRKGLAKGKCESIQTATSGLSFKRSLLTQIIPMSPLLPTDNYLKLAACFLSCGIFVKKALGLQRVHSTNSYTEVRSIPHLKAINHITTAFFLKESFDGLSTFSDNLFSVGQAYLLFSKLSGKHGGRLQKTTYEETISIRSLFLSNSSFKRKIKIFIRSLYHFYKIILHFKH